MFDSKHFTNVFFSNFSGNPDHLRESTFSLTYVFKALLNLTLKLKIQKDKIRDQELSQDLSQELSQELKKY